MGHRGLYGFALLHAVQNRNDSKEHFRRSLTKGMVNYGEYKNGGGTSGPRWGYGGAGGNAPLDF
jgi:hypothetical protein